MPSCSKASAQRIRDDPLRSASNTRTEPMLLFRPVDRPPPVDALAGSDDARPCKLPSILSGLEADNGAPPRVWSRHGWSHQQPTARSAVLALAQQRAGKAGRPGPARSHQEEEKVGRPQEPT